MSNDMNHHIKIYKKVFIALLLLTGVTVCVSYYDFGGIMWLAVGVGLFIALVLMFVYQLPKLPIKYLLPSVAVLSILVVLLVNAVMYSPRILFYIEAVPLALLSLQQNVQLPPVIEQQIVNLYPIWLRWENLMAFNLLPLRICGFS